MIYSLLTARQQHLPQTNSALYGSTNDVKTVKSNHLDSYTYVVQNASRLDIITTTLSQFDNHALQPLKLITTQPYPHIPAAISNSVKSAINFEVTSADKSLSKLLNISANETETDLGSTQITMTRNVVSALMDDSTPGLDHASHHKIMLLVLIGIFMIISLTISVAVIVFCKKKNSVFMLQKCEQDSELEMDDFNETDEVETSDSEYETIDSSPISGCRRSETYPCLSKYVNENKQQTESLNSKCSKNKHRRQNSINRNKGNNSRSSSSIPLLQSSKKQTGLRAIQHDQKPAIKSETDRHILKKSVTFSADIDYGKKKRKQLIKQSSHQSKRNLFTNPFFSFSTSSQKHTSDIDTAKTKLQTENSKRIKGNGSNSVKLKSKSDQSKSTKLNLSQSHESCVVPVSLDGLEESMCFINETDNCLGADDEVLVLDGKLEIL